MVCANCANFKKFSEKYIKEQEEILAEMESRVNHPNIFVRLLLVPSEMELKFQRYRVQETKTEGFCALNPEWQQVLSTHTCSYMKLK